MQITYDNYPGLLFTSFNKDNAPVELPFEVASLQGREYLAHSSGFQEMWGIIGSKNSLGGTATNYLLPVPSFHRIDSDINFRNTQFRSFFENYVKPQYGNILFKDGGHYVYLLLGKQETRQLKQQEGRYMAAALFKHNFFVGFEEAVITEQGLQVSNGGHYEGMDIGGYLSFCLIALAYSNSKRLDIYENEHVRETILKL